MNLLVDLLHHTGTGVARAVWERAVGEAGGAPEGKKRRGPPVGLILMRTRAALAVGGIGNNATAVGDASAATVAPYLDHATAEELAAMVYVISPKVERARGMCRGRRSSAWVRRRIRGRQRAVDILRYG